MKINSIINRYIFSELIPPCAITLAFFTFVFMMTTLLDITNLVVNYGISLSSVLLLLFYSMPFFITYIIPMSVMMAVLLTFLRLSGDNEIVAMKTGGISLYGLLPPVLLFCLIGCLVTGFMAIYALPWGKLSFKKQVVKIATSNFEAGLKERTFNDSFKGVMIYVNKIDMQNKILIDVFIEDQRTSNIVSTVVAPKGRLYSEPDKLTAHLRLYNGIINNVDIDKSSVNSISFDTYDVNLNFKSAVSGKKRGHKNKEEMSLAELRQYLKNATKKNEKYYAALMEFHEKFSIPFACFALGLLAVPLGLQSVAARQSYGLVLGLFFFLFYYLMLTIAWSMGESGIYPPAIGMWAPNIFLGGIGIYLIVRTANERPVKLDFLFILIKRMLSYKKGTC